MELFLTIIFYADVFASYRFEEAGRNDTYCQNIYWQPNALENMNEA